MYGYYNMRISPNTMISFFASSLPSHGASFFAGQAPNQLPRHLQVADGRQVLVELPWLPMAKNSQVMLVYSKLFSKWLIRKKHLFFDIHHTSHILPSGNFPQLLNMTIEIVDFPIIVIFHSYVSHYRRVHPTKSRQIIINQH